VKVWHTLPMPTRSSKRKETDPNVRAFLTVQRATGQLSPEEPIPDTRNPHAVALGKLGGSKGGKARAKKLSARKRIEIAKKAARTRWGK
jgi:hypothetical protein